MGVCVCVFRNINFQWSYAFVIGFYYLHFPCFRLRFFEIKYCLCVLYFSSFSFSFAVCRLSPLLFSAFEWFRFNAIVKSTIHGICKFCCFCSSFIFITNDFIAWNTNENVFALNKIRLRGVGGAQCEITQARSLMCAQTFQYTLKKKLRRRLLLHNCEFNYHQLLFSCESANPGNELHL